MSASDPSEAGRLFAAGDLHGAIDAANRAVKAAPLDANRRTTLAEFLLFAGALERADNVLEACSELDPSLVVYAAEFRQLIRAEVARREAFSDGRLPDFVGAPTETQHLALAAMVALRAGDPMKADESIALAEQTRIRPRGVADESDFDDFRDADDLLAGTLEILSTAGKYFWIPVELLEQLSFRSPRRPRDLFWRRASIKLADGFEADVYVPAIYIETSSEDDNGLRLGRATDWRQHKGNSLVRGLGAVTFLIGDAGRTLMQLEKLHFEPCRP